MIYRTALRRFADCLERGTGREHWPGPQVRTLIQPHWAERAFELRAQAGEFSEAASEADQIDKDQAA